MTVNLAYAVISTLGLAAWLVIPSALAGLAMHAWETRQADREVIARSKAMRSQYDREPWQHRNMAL